MRLSEVPGHRCCRCDKKSTMSVLLQLVEFHVASAAIDDHAVALGNLNDVVIDDRDSLLVAHAALVHKLSLLLRHGKASYLGHVLAVPLDVLDGDTRA